MKMPLITLILAKVYKKLHSFSQRPKRKKLKFILIYSPVNHKELLH